MPLTAAQLRTTPRPPRRRHRVFRHAVQKYLALDPAGLRRNISQLAGQQVCAIVAGAGTGDLHSLSNDEHLAVVKATIEEVKGRLPVLAGVGFSPQTAVDMARACTAADAELAGIMRGTVIPLYAFRGRKKGCEVSVMKTMMDLTGQVGGFVRPPLNVLRADEVKEIRALLKPWKKWL